MSAADIRVFRQKIDSTASMKKIFNAMELIATSRIGKARQRVAASMPYANAITRAVSAVSSQQDIEHVLTSEPENPRRAAVLIMSSDRGLADRKSTRLNSSHVAISYIHILSLHDALPIFQRDGTDRYFANR